MKKALTPVVVIAIVVGLLFAFFTLDEGRRMIGLDPINEVIEEQEVDVNTFESCVLAGYDVEEGNPRRCVGPEGKVFTEKSKVVSYDIVLSSPRPKAALRSPVKINGEAVGPWFFEANFSAELIDSDGEVIAAGIITAEDEWMTEELVPYSGEIEYENFSGQAELVLKSANPSGLPENQKMFSIPVTLN